jgi:hypothetical protein
MKKKKWKIREKSPLWYFKEIATSLWLFVIIGIMILVIIAFSRPPEAAGAVMKIHIIEQPDKLYDIPLEADLQLHIKELCEAYGVDMPLVLAVIGQESNYDPAAIGDSGNSIGLMQIQPMHHSRRMDRLGITDLTDPYQNITVGIDLLAELLADSGDTEWAITAYNAGAGTADFNKKIGMRSEYAESVMILREEIAQ